MSNLVNQSIETLNTQATQADPFEGNTWQSYFQQQQRVTQSQTAAMNGGQFPTFANLGQYTVADLPTGTSGAQAYATNGLKVGESTGNGTGVPVYYSNGAWRVWSTDAPVQS